MFTSAEGEVERAAGEKRQPVHRTKRQQGDSRL